MFRESIQKMVDRLDGGLAGILMGFDGIAVESYTRTSANGDIGAVGLELAHVVSQMSKAAEMLDGGGLREVTMRADKLVVLVQVVSEEYFVACAVRPDANFGKARFLMRLLGPQIQSEL